MRTPRFQALAVIALVVAAACGGGPAASSTGPTPAEPTPVTPTASPAAEGDTYWMRLTTWQAIPPVNLFSLGDTTVIDGNGVLVVPGVVPAIFPGPLVFPQFGRQVSDEGKAQILSWAKELGLLDGPTDFTAGNAMPGQMTGRIELTVDGKLVTLTGLTGDGTAAVDPEPGSAQAFSELWRRLSDLPGSLNTQLGPESPYTPAGYAILTGQAPDPQGAGLDAQVMVWPLSTPVNEFGTSVANGTARCGLATGDDAAAMGAALAKANQVTQWTATAETSATFGITARPIVAGENPCAEVFGVE
jgi:hypothetical protein